MSISGSSRAAEYSGQPMVEMARIARITHQLYERQQFAYLIVDHQWRVVEASGNLAEFGFPQLSSGADAQAELDFLVGLDSHLTLDLPIVLTPTDHPVHIVLLPEADSLTVVIMDASREYEQQQLVQQKANENELLLAQQRRLMRDLEGTQAALLEKNSELEEASRLQSSFLSGVSHEFRTPLSAIIGYTEMVLERLDSQPRAATNDQLMAVRRSSKHLLSLVENLLDHGKFDADEIVINPQPVKVQDVVDDIESVLMPLANNKQIDLLIKSMPAPLPVCLLDDTRLRQVLLNICGNAIKFTDQGSVKVVVKIVDDHLQVVVADTGIGISAEDLAQVRRPFWQASNTGKAGTGLGLTITERIIEMLGGHISIESVVGAGTKVQIELPAPVVADQSQATTSQVKAQVPQMHFLLVEDDPDIANLLMLMLEEKAMHVTHVENGELAVQAVSQVHYDVILMDLQMPVMDGYKATEKIRASRNTTPILVMTASSLDADRSRAQRLGCDGYLIKPVVVDEIISLAGELLMSPNLTNPEV